MWIEMKGKILLDKHSIANLSFVSEDKNKNKKIYTNMQGLRKYTIPFSNNVTNTIKRWVRLRKTY